MTAPGLALFTDRVAAAMRRDPPLVPLATPVAEAVAAMAAAAESCVVAVDAQGRAVGILTERDVAQRVAFRMPPEAPLADVMSAPVRTVPADEHLYRAVGVMQARGLRHLVVVDRQARAIGLLHRFEAYAAASARLLAAVETLARGDDEAGFAATRTAQAGLARTLLDAGVPAADVIEVVAEINLDIHRWVVERALAAAGPPPVPFTLLVMGSGGRGESQLAPDQDNGLILADYPDARHGEVDAWFIPFAEDLNNRLEVAGFPLCKGHVMARNPVWRKTLAQWQAQFSLWAERRSPVAVLFGDIAFDFRAAWGDPEPASELRGHLMRTLAAHPAFLRALAAENAKITVGLGFWGGFRDDEPDRPGVRTDLKRSGLMPLVSATRLLALKHGVAETGTRARLAALAALGPVAPAEAQGLTEAFERLAGALLRQQLDAAAAGRPPGTLVALPALPKAEQAAIRAAMRRVASFQKVVESSFGGGLW
jgi:signal-transduction protein with cAMP-binding, CBS, and nucleotidyltransferase domain